MAVAESEESTAFQERQLRFAPALPDSSPSSGGRRNRSWLVDSRTGEWYPRYRAALVFADLLSISAAVAATFLFLFTGQDELAGAPGVHYVWLAGALIAVWLVVLETTDSRAKRTVGTGLEEYRRVLTASLYLFAGLAMASYWLQAEVSRALFVTTLPAGALLLLASRWVARQRLHALRRRGLALTPALVVGSPESVPAVVSDLAANRLGGFEAAGVCLVGPLNAGVVESLTHLPISLAAELPTEIASGRYGAVVVADGLGRDETRELAWRLENRPIELLMVPRLTDVSGPRMKMRSAHDLSLMHVELPAFSGWKLVLKRAFDIVFSLVALVLLTPVLIVVALMIKLDDGGPVLFRQERIGRNGEPFIIHKFRTMCVDAEARIADLISANGGTALLFKLEDDPRITRVGRWLRKYSIDELPQFWTVLRGGMSVVGPRPQVAREVAEYTDRHHRRLLIKPGITGLWQVNGRSELSMEESIRLDLRYVENWSLVGDLTLILKTVRAALRPSGAF